VTALRVLGVHGVGNLQPGLEPPAAAERLAGWWSRALLKPGSFEPDRLDLTVAYYAHHLTKTVPQGQDDLDAADQDEVLTWATLLGLPGETAQGQLARPARAAVDWVARRFGLDTRLARAFAGLFFKEVGAYFTRPESRTSALADVAGAIARTEPQVIIAHSLGSVVGYETLWAHPHPPVDLLLTVGSPLAMPDVVYDRLQVRPADRSRPPGVRRWINVSDPGDIVAVPRGGVARGFTGLDADLTDAIHAFDFHRVAHYLSCGATQGILAATL
jgi:hypothetical protein